MSVKVRFLASKSEMQIFTDSLLSLSVFLCICAAYGQFILVSEIFEVLPHSSAYASQLCLRLTALPMLHSSVYASQLCLRFTALPTPHSSVYASQL